MCGGDFMSKNPEEAMDFLNYVAKVSRGWDEPNRGKVELPTPKPHDETESEKRRRGGNQRKKKGRSGRKEDHDSTVNEDPEKIVINEDVMKKHMPPPFPQALHGKKGTMHQKFLKC
ncbi:hypothetical protein CK203_112617 [Vitis vinifera]|uniref:Uncharacterized protein n=1 Tax=Vitis vinifera TaxID=29760 RepID=A0A438CE56_VITVI|nr:hypothetical protein CK203_112617 [Vitis vinifera]